MLSTRVTVCELTGLAAVAPGYRMAPGMGGGEEFASVLAGCLAAERHIIGLYLTTMTGRCEYDERIHIMASRGLAGARVAMHPGPPHPAAVSGPLYTAGTDSSARLAAVGMAYIGRWQRTRCPVPTVCSGGNSVSHCGPMWRWQRPLNGQP